MKIGEAVFLAVSIGIAGAGVLATVRATGRRPVRTAPARWTIATDGLRAAFGSVGAFYAVLVASVLPLILITWPLGAWAHYKPVSGWNKTVLAAYDSGRDHTLTSAMKLFTQMGNWYPIVTVALVGSALLAWAAKSKRWLPPVVIISTLLGERYLQKAITNIVHLKHPPTDLGTYPSGGVARLVCIYGIVGFMALRVLAPRSRRGLIGGIWLLAFLTWIEGYSRIHLQKHWLSDPIGGLILGVGILAVAVAASTLLPWPEPETEAELQSEPTARHRGGRRRRQRPPMRLRASQAVLGRGDVGEVVLDGIAPNGDPAVREPVDALSVQPSASESPVSFKRTEAVADTGYEAPPAAGLAPAESSDESPDLIHFEDLAEADPAPAEQTGSELPEAKSPKAARTRSRTKKADDVAAPTDLVEAGTPVRSRRRSPKS
jgi:membrane-associated phospholipid phosphatase